MKIFRGPKVEFPATYFGIDTSNIITMNILVVFDSLKELRQYYFANSFRLLMIDNFTLN